MNCSQCGQPLAPTAQFCANCGKPRPTEDKTSFAQAQDQYFMLKGQVDLGRLTPEQFEARLKELMVQDAQGRYWLPGADSGEWYVNQGGRWVRGTPPIDAGGAPSPVSGPVSPPPGRGQLKAAGLSRNTLIVLVAAAGACLLVAIFAGIFLLFMNRPAAVPTVVVVPYSTATNAPGGAVGGATTVPTTIAQRTATGVPATTAPTLPRATATVTRTTVAVNLAGAWTSNFGPVTLQSGAPQPDGRIPVTGSWIQGDGQKGTIQNGLFDPATRVLSIQYLQPWNNVTGQATFTLSADGNTLKGSYRQANGEGDWTMQRGATVQQTGPATAIAANVSPTVRVQPITATAQVTKTQALPTAPPPTAAPTSTSPPPTPIVIAPVPTNAPAPTSTPSYSPGVYVTNMRTDPADPKRGQGVAFIATFLNTTGAPQGYNWLVQIYDSDTNKRFGETGVLGIAVPPGTAEFRTPNDWKVTGAGGCISFYAQAQYQNPEKARIPFNATNGNPFSYGFQVCPVQ